jgi:transitional endoplasmic reticulum ATPase
MGTHRYFPSVFQGLISQQFSSNFRPLKDNRPINGGHQMQDDFEIKVVIGYVKNILNSKKMTSPNISYLANFIDSQISVLNLTTKHNKLIEIIENSIGWNVDKLMTRSKINATRTAMMTIIESYESRNTVVREGIFSTRIHELSKVLGLDKDEVEFLGFLIRYQCHDPLNQMINDITSNGVDIADICTTCLNITKDKFYKLLSRKERLLTSGAIESPASTGRYLNDCFNVPDLIVVAMQRAYTCQDSILQLIMGDPAAASLDWQDFDHIANSRDRLLRFLKKAVKQRITGINILLYGPPGTGKTEFCKTLADKLRINLYSLTERNKMGEEPNRNDRTSGYRLAQNILRQMGGSLLLFDEMDDIFAPDFMMSLFNVRASSGSKVFMNRLLEDNPIPTIWTINDPQILDETIIRRMSIAIEIKVPSAPILERVWKKQLSKQKVTIADEELKRLAQSGASPAIVNSAVRFAKLSGGKADDCIFATQSIIKAIKGKLPLSDNHAVEFIHELVVANHDLKSLTKRIVESGNKNFSFCLHGPPGTGKSVYARYLADQMNMPVVYKRASDLLSKWVGDSEKNIAAAFSEAKDSESFLIFDEADSLLSDRRHSRANWEVTQVNEMLTWMEQHPLPFACTTNLIDSLDQASMRRFTFKVRFNYLDPDGVCAAFEHFWGFRVSPKMAQSLRFVTPGDFAVVKKSAEYLGRKQTAEDIIELLHDEVKAKSMDLRKKVGFQAS